MDPRPGRAPLGAHATHPHVRRAPSEASPPIRAQILVAAIAELAHSGSEFFDTPALCSRLHIARTSINHYFGGRTGLIAEATTSAYEAYVEELKQAANSKDSPPARLEAWMDAQIKWFRNNPGIAVLMEMPHPTYRKVMLERFAPRLIAAFKYNMAVLAALVRGVQEDRVTSLAFTRETAPYQELIGQDVTTLMRTASVGTSSLGAAVWLAGDAIPASHFEEGHLQSAVFSQHAKWMVRTITATR